MEFVDILRVSRLIERFTCHFNFDRESCVHDGYSTIPVWPYECGVDVVGYMVSSCGESLSEFLCCSFEPRCLDVCICIVAGKHFVPQLVAGASDPALYGATIISSNYTKYGSNFYFNGCAIINWGALINAFISFIIIAVVLFIIVKVINSAQRKREELKAKALEEYYEKHPEERPKPVEPGVPAPTQEELLTQIRDILKEKK